MYDQGIPNFVNPTKIERAISQLYTPTASSTHTFTHNLSGTPDNVDMFALCLADDLGYSAGDIIPMNTNQIGYIAAATQHNGISVTNMSETSVTISVADNGVIVLRPDTFQFSTITTASWGIYVEARKETIGDVPDITKVGEVVLEEKIISNGESSFDFDLQQYFNLYDTFAVEFTHVKNITDNSSLYFRVSKDGGDTFLSSSYNQVISGASGGAASINEITSQAQFTLGATGTSGNAETMTGEIIIPEASKALALHQYRFTRHGRAASGADQAYDDFGFCSAVQNAQTTHLRFFPSSGNFDEGIFKLIGRRKAS